MKALIPLALIAFACISGCSSPDSVTPPETASQPATSAAASLVEQSLDAYAQVVVAATKGNVKDPTPAEKTLDAPLSYVIKFHTSDPALMAKEDGDKNRVSYAFNAALQEGWSKRFCTPQLKSVMTKNGIFLVSGHLLDATGKLQVFTSCTQ